MAGNFAKLENTQNKHAAGIDKAIAKENKLKKLGLWKKPLHWTEEPVPKSWNDKNFRERYPKFINWEQKLETIAPIGIDRMLTELRDYCDYDQQPQQAYNWFKEMHSQQLEPRDAWHIIRRKLGWE